MVDKSPRITVGGLRVLSGLIDAAGELSGAELASGTGLFSGTIYPLLIRYEKAGLVASRWEEGDPSELGRPRRRYYRITGLGVRAYRSQMMPFVGNMVPI